MLVKKVHGQALALAFAGREHGFADEDKAHAGHAFQTLAAGRNERVKAQGLGVDGQGRKAAHGVNDQALAMAFTHGGHLGQRVQDTGTGFAVDEHHVADAGVLQQVGI